MDEQINGWVDTIKELEKENAELKLRLGAVSCRREQLIAFLRQQSKLHYITIYENDFEFADKLLKAINCR